MATLVAILTAVAALVASVAALLRATGGQGQSSPTAKNPPLPGDPGWPLPPAAGWLVAVVSRW